MPSYFVYYMRKPVIMTRKGYNLYSLSIRNRRFILYRIEHNYMRYRDKKNVPYGSQRNKLTVIIFILQKKITI